MTELKPAAFMSYVHADDKYGHLTTLRERLSDEVCVQTGQEFPIFQDRKDIQWGQNWRARIEESLDAATFLIPIITPGFFNSQACRQELQHFLEHEKHLGRSDLILPIYYVDCPLLNDGALRATDDMAEAIAARQYADWRDLRFEPFTSPQVGRTLARLAVQIRDALPRAKEPRKTVAAPSSAQVAERILPIANELSEITRRPSAKTEPPTRVVDPMHRGDYLTIGEAIAAANPGDRIIVRPGLYQEGLVMDKPLEIIGGGEPGEVVVQAAERSVLLFQTTMGRVTNLTLRQMGGDKWWGVDIAQGRLELEYCEIAGQSLACIAIHGGADPRLRRNHIRDGKQVGILVYENGQGTLEDNDIFGSTLAGVAISTDGNPTLRRNRIHDAKSGGVVVYENGQRTLEDNAIFDNAGSGVIISTGGNPTLRRNRIHGKQGGVSVNESGQGILEDNDIFDNAGSGVTISTDGNPTLRHNRIHGSKQGGVLVDESGQGTLEDNDIFGNTLVGVAIATGGNPTLCRNRIHDDELAGVLVAENGLGALEDNDIFGNGGSGVTIKTGGNPALRRNRINKNSYEAVQIDDGGSGTIEDNDLRDNERGAWNIAADSEPNVKRARNLE